MVSGGAGFVGSHVVDRLAADGAEAVVCDNFTTGSRRNLAPHQSNPRVRIAEADILDLPRLTAEMRGCDSVRFLVQQP